jgi:hypothetical protein
MQKAKIASLPTSCTPPFATLRRQLWVPRRQDRGFAGLLRRDEGGYLRPAHQIR